jgi:hypothetical protein
MTWTMSVSREERSSLMKSNSLIAFSDQLECNYTVTNSTRIVARKAAKNEREKKRECSTAWLTAVRKVFLV